MNFTHEINMQELQHPAQHLTDNYRKDEGSNNFKFLDLSHREQKEILQSLRLIEAWRDMDNAEGFTLDKIGKNVLELRSGRSDKDYRKAIKIKIRGNLSAGLVEDLNAISQILFEDNFKSVSETWHQADYNFEPGGVAIHLHSLAIGGQPAFWRDIAFITDIVKAGGVGLYARQSELHDVSIFSAAGLSSLRREYIVVDTQPLPTGFVSHDAAGPVFSSRWFANETLPMPENVPAFHATGGIAIHKEYISESFEMSENIANHTGAAAYEMRKESLEIE